MDHLLQMLFHAVLRLESHKLESMDPESMEQESALLVVYVTNTLYEICYGHCTEFRPRHLFLGNMVPMLMHHQYEIKDNIFTLNSPQNEEYFVSMAHAPTNLMIHAIRINAITATSFTAIDFIDDLPRNIVSVCTLPLIVGYIRNGCISLLNIPDDISQLIAAFF